MSVNLVTKPTQLHSVRGLQNLLTITIHSTTGMNGGSVRLASQAITLLNVKLMALLILSYHLLLLHYLGQLLRGRIREIEMVLDSQTSVLAALSRRVNPKRTQINYYCAALFF